MRQLTVKSIWNGKPQEDFILPLSYAGWDISLFCHRGDGGQRFNFNAVLRLDGRARDDFEFETENNGAILGADDLANVIKAATDWIRVNWIRCGNCGAWQDDGYYSDGIETVCSDCARAWGLIP